MASLRRNTNPLNDTTTAKFLYTILKQLDHKQIDWSEVASELDITNGHAARMRFSRFKQHMEGIQPTTRKPRAESHTQRKAKLEKKQKQEPGRGKKAGKGDRDMNTIPAHDEKNVTMDEDMGDGRIRAEPGVKMEPGIKTEHPDDMMGDGNVSQMMGFDGAHGFLGFEDEHETGYGWPSDFDNSTQVAPIQALYLKAEPTVKEEMDEMM